jgi:hypothetical protein
LKKKVKDHLGNEFNSTKEMSEHYNINYLTYMYRRNKGYSLKDALTLEKHSGRTNKDAHTKQTT